MKNKDIYIDDAGWGFPLCGVFFGIYYDSDQRFDFAEVPVAFFQSPLFERKAYLTEAADRVSDILNQANCLPSSSGQIHICPGYVNNRIAYALAQQGFSVCREPIGEPLQTKLEEMYKKHIQKITGQNFYYDPKLFTKKEVAHKFFRVVNWIKANNRFDIAKTGWKYFKKRNQQRRLYG